ncbi:hypothetical protein CEH05_06705 [Halobacillus halophilus]|uniref:Uncharacterized protein n=1 Tax=Halobacillus halophilus (strain ATCC 35676 / DSM 2266 / JCM 20832 / KCTC 3685 / LMG 17431 / NBRC 102448 / NCIMB 2269) TaxID=866895 RepID=I0JKL1_HALH3|nr:hypothetical protein [Halobacillus halophilus]ASF38820.1 hypothetical protein CEH05_06705 [Halobacillus halophilus]CCG44680.1 hypothetical protein HBHAL_2333 [Halobacillus halophilus DSM 2266]
MTVLVDLIMLWLELTLLKVSEEDIEGNLKELKKHTWFQDYLSDETKRQQIIHDAKVRRVIGRFSKRKLRKDSYQAYCKKKLDRALR